MAAERTERLMNLVICLLHTRSFLTADRLREIIPAYADAPSDEAFKRMFERDKEDLRDLGIPLEVGSNSHFDDEQGYRIPKTDYALPEIRLEADEAAAVGLAARMWSSATQGAAATRALRKLETAGVELVPLPEGLQPRLGAGGAGLPTVHEALREGRRLRFDYRGANDAAPVARKVEPWGVVCWRGRWYLVGHDLDREAPRAFRLSRVVGEPIIEGKPRSVTVPEGVDLSALVSATDAPQSEALARVKVRHDRAMGLRRQTIDIADDGDGWDVVTVPCPDPHRLAEQVLSYGADAVIVSPAEARDAIVSRLKALIATAGAAAGTATERRATR
ncbi:MAG TPA: WYL domain-containing protein [Mycobacteriales bacterium]|nr:WYL domain-containing protein [Mycobacteriales bacterium]